MNKTPGRIAYEAEVAEYPHYHNGKPRRTWDMLPALAKQSWEKDPRPRVMCESHRIPKPKSAEGDA